MPTTSNDSEPPDLDVWTFDPMDLIIRAAMVVVSIVMTIVTVVLVMVAVLHTFVMLVAAAVTDD
jgi:hypothetical protein